jgi:nicotinate-nucleotide adenylyltransferase
VRLAIFGGSFDPPHIGHLLVAHDAVEQLSLDRLIFVPAASQPLKPAAATPAWTRLEMVRLSAGDDSRFEVSDLEVARGGLSFTVDTVAHFAELFPGADRFLLLGADVLATFGQWKEPARVLQLARPVILARDGLPASLPDGLAADAIQLTARRVDVSSTEIRARVRAGKSIRGFVTEAVAAVIDRDRLYR